MALCAIFEELENISSSYLQLDIHGYITRIKRECNIFIDIIGEQGRQIEQQSAEIQRLKDELEMINTTILEKLNNDIIHMRKSVSLMAQPKKTKYVEELI